MIGADIVRDPPSPRPPAALAPCVTSPTGKVALAVTPPTKALDEPGYVTRSGGAPWTKHTQSHRRSGRPWSGLRGAQNQVGEDPEYGFFVLDHPGVSSQYGHLRHHRDAENVSAEVIGLSGNIGGPRRRTPLRDPAGRHGAGSRTMVKQGVDGDLQQPARRAGQRVKAVARSDTFHHRQRHDGDRRSQTEASRIEGR
jgi:hypothetical protein